MVGQVMYFSLPHLLAVDFLKIMETHKSFDLFVLLIKKCIEKIKKLYFALPQITQQ